ncbi:hypothetical protein HYS31_03940 [Candidatus Woesearchaeota archaeon]|nr:hypothetical protein [Candidatus Woesearchaeota archaeon]
MRKNIALLLLMLLVFPYLAYAATTFIIKETEKISLVPNATDPDNDRLEFTYESPLNENGEWQTTYGDAGEYRTSIIASDGVSTDSKDVLIIVERKEEAPSIDDFSPKESPISIYELDSIDFWVSASDLNKDQLSYIWLFDGIDSMEGQRFTYHSDYNSYGQHEIKVIVSDGKLEASKRWLINVANVDLESLIRQISGVSVNEGETARLTIPEFEKYGLDYAISDPIGDDNEWKTSYDDAGAYKVWVRAEGEGFKGEKIVEVVVNDVDRPPVFDAIGNRIISEGEQLKIIISAVDPDGDEVTYSASALPEGAELKGSIFTWVPGYNTVNKQGLVDSLIGRFSDLGKNFYVKFVASAKDKRTEQNVVMTVKDINRAPVIDEIPDIRSAPGDTIEIKVNAYDPDGDKITLKYSGFMDSDTYKPGYNDAGIHSVKVTASDGALEASQTVNIIIEKTNRAPIFSIIKDTKVEEGNTISILLHASDPDGDDVQYSLNNPPEGSSLNGNSFSWPIGFEVAGKKATKVIELYFAASDGREVSGQTARIEIKDKNRAPRVISSSRNVIVNISQPVLLEVNAVDDDNDPITYTWDFGLFSKYRAGSSYLRSFDSPGNNLVKVKISDGTDSIEQPIDVYLQDNGKSPFGSVSFASHKVNITYRKQTTTYKAYQAGNSQASTQGNTLPRILDFSRNVEASVNKPVILFVKAADEDTLSYMWEFGPYEKYIAGPSIQRVFTSAGAKTAKVTVSDGKGSVEQVINVNVR